MIAYYTFVGIDKIDKADLVLEAYVSVCRKLGTSDRRCKRKDGIVNNLLLFRTRILDVHII